MEYNTNLGGGSWTCEKCGKTIQGTSIYHECVKHPKNYKLYTLPANTSVWSIDLQENVKFDRDVYVILMNTTVLNDYVFVKKVERFENITLSWTTGTDCASYRPTKIEFGVSLKYLIFVKETEIYE